MPRLPAVVESNYVGINSYSIYLGDAMITDQPWYTDHRELFAVAQMLTAADWLTTARDVVDFIEKPTKYIPERDLWIAHNRPVAVGAPGWAAFVEALDRLDDQDRLAG